MRARLRLSKLGCTHDGAQTLVCADAFSVAAVDHATGKVLWYIKDGDDSRLVPHVTAVWHGRVYCSATSGPVALDTRTGKEMPTRPEAHRSWSTSTWV
ncbi:hypothetical protein [Streptomyces sp. NPDC046685]|uniref:hypothetical protein n=1 Tax=Streptomyces sp. NPDC046685 TaxID=3157202 RepID=UPI0034014C1D